MKWMMIVGMTVLLVGCATTVPRTEATTLRNRLFNAPLLEARSAGNALLRLPLMRSESRTRREDVVAFLGRPDRETTDAIAYKTNGGPLWIEFTSGVLIHAALVTPPRWRGTDEELAEWWSKTRNQENWDQY
jgi:hypothetical protein